jgi:glycerophosphoryl diester phosphodiesterase
MAIVTGTTAAPSYVTRTPGGSDFDLAPLLTVGDEIPLLEGDLSSFTTSSTQTYAFAGIPDGLGVYNDGTYNYVFLNHEISATSSSGAALTSDISSTVPGKIQGARVSLLVFDQDWNTVGGKNLIERAVDSTGTYALDTNTGLYTSSTGTSLSFTRFCSAYLAQSGFVGQDGQEAPIFFTAEETDSKSRGWAITPDGTATALDSLGRFAKENVLSASQYRATNSDKTVLISTEDNADGELYMYVGTKTAADPNGLNNGDLYVLRVDGTDFEGQLAQGVKNTAQWTKVDKSAVFGPDGKPLATGDALSAFANGAGRSTNFQRLEDIAEDPNSPGTFYAVTTGTKEKLGGKVSDPSDDAKVASEAENPYGRLYRFSLNPNDPTAPIDNFELLVKGGPGTGTSYDNVVVDKKGNVFIMEDETAFGGELMAAENRDGSIWRYNIASGQLTRVLEIDENAAGTQFNDPKARGEWESSGIIELDDGSYLFDVQAHTVKGSALGGNYVEGGQLLRAIPKDSLTGAAGDFQVGATDSSGFPVSGASTLPLASTAAGTSPQLLPLMSLPGLGGVIANQQTASNDPLGQNLVALPGMQATPLG